jgi:hypothetical protein
MPWEILKPYSPKGDNGYDFLCQKHSFSRLISDSENRIQKGRQFKKLAVVVPSDTRLVKAVEEQDWLKKFGRDHGIEVLTPSTFKEVKDTLRNDAPDIWHFTSHGKYNAQDPLSSAIKMEGRNELRVNFVRSTDMNFGRNNPVVFLNACQTGEQGMSLTGVQSWAMGFIGVGACAFIAPLWSVRDKTAYAFAKELYTELSNGESLGEAVRNARIKCKEIGDPSWLAYQLYGNPFDRINFGLATASDMEP